MQQNDAARVELDQLRVESVKMVETDNSVRVWTSGSTSNHTDRKVVRFYPSRCPARC